MDSEATRSQSQEPQLGLPDVASIKIRRTRLDPPVRTYRLGQQVSFDEAIELLVQTAVAIPLRAYTPALFIGEVPVTHYDKVGTNLYRFRAFEIDRLQRGARISIGWPFAPAAKIPTPFVFDPGALPVA